ncbi:MAG: PilZ domain-containing protein [Candidatus Omnitrophica bacterium]|nr:PilZ domain-containing protein [Candidatus Omnitrophota bacterium]
MDRKTSAKTGKERRRYERLYIPAEAACTIADKRMKTAKLLNISEGGLMAETEDLIGKEERIEFVVPAEKRGRPLLIGARLAWFKKSKTANLLGFQAYKISSKRELARLMLDRSSGFVQEKQQPFASHERRKHARLRVLITVKYRTIGIKKIDAGLLNISGGGAGLSLGVKISPGDEVGVEIRVEGEAKPFIARARTKWVKKVGDMYHCGIEFLSMKNREGFAGLLCDRMLGMSLDAAVEGSARKRSG